MLADLGRIHPIGQLVLCWVEDAEAQPGYGVAVSSGNLTHDGASAKAAIFAAARLWNGS